MMLNDGGNNKDLRLVEALPPSTAINVNLNVVHGPLQWLLAVQLSKPLSHMKLNLNNVMQLSTLRPGIKLTLRQALAASP